MAIIGVGPGGVASVVQAEVSCIDKMLIISLHHKTVDTKV